MFRIGEFSKLGFATVKTLRFYDEAGLLKPAKTDIVTGYRYYTTDQLYTLHKIQSYRQAGLSVDEIRRIFEGVDERALLLSRKAELDKSLSETVSKLSRISFLLGTAEEKAMNNYTVTIKDIPSYTVFSCTMKIDRYEDLMTEIPAMGEKLAAANPNLKCVEPDYCFRVDLDHEYRESNITLEYCQAVCEAGTPVDNIIFKTIPAVKVASILHRGPYSRFGDAYAFVFKWIEDNGYTVAGDPRECYIDGIWNCESEEDWLSEIQVPIQ
ncbi:MAG TPA: MerR family transcriptional regulator [Methanocorpusculum sp.]|nr:MerR family transcriptional regulator [Methanocorpusculum sp.]